MDEARRVAANIAKLPTLISTKGMSALVSAAARNSQVKARLSRQALDPVHAEHGGHRALGMHALESEHAEEHHKKADEKVHQRAPSPRQAFHR